MENLYVNGARAQALVPLVMGLISVFIGWRSKSRRQTLVALLAGLTGMVFAGLHLARATGAIGTGSGKLGAIVAMVVALIGTILGGMRWARTPEKLQ